MVIDMKKAIIDPREVVSKIIGYDSKGNPIFQVIPNSARVAEVADAEFPIAEPLFWVSCADDVKADQWYYDTVQQQCFAVSSPSPVSDQPTTTGAQTL
jgi:hypothetical protein